jgi:hypothetical protein
LARYFFPFPVPRRGDGFVAEVAISIAGHRAVEREEPSDEGQVCSEAGHDNGGVEVGKCPEDCVVQDVGKDRGGGAMAGSWIWAGMRGGAITVPGASDITISPSVVLLEVSLVHCPLACQSSIRDQVAIKEIPFKENRTPNQNERPNNN